MRRRIVLAGGDPSTIAIVAVTKSFDSSMVRAAAAAGLSAMGENYVGELEAKDGQTADLVLRWHFLGALQSNKIARVLAHADVVSAVTRDKEIDIIATLRPGMTVDVQVDLTGQPRRHGASAAEVQTLVSRARDRGLDVRGLMTVASPEPTLAAAQFAQLRRLAQDLGLRGRSMGMSEDLELAVEQGSTEIRVGRALFGPRTAPGALA
ncbi:MAG: alanine racemase [Acidobacteriota bacterium]|nr:alanine racemase [Acidobacteriota bacterium]MDE3092432.1 alanine racemase [Acidobacteriota bacterium]MDE3146861.1 alanine racemase [Acidobacteriota bacterium]